MVEGGGGSSARVEDQGQRGPREWRARESINLLSVEL